MTMINERKLVVVSGPSGCGKDTVVSCLKQQRSDIRQSVSCTTRAPREGEQHGVNYYYISREEFLQRLENGRMLEYNEFAGNLYGTPRDELEQLMQTGDTVVLVIDVHGAVNVKRIYPGALLVFLLPPSIDELVERLSGRGSEEAAVIEERLEIA
ncbi:MAG: guanylate kinase, partial [Oscillospiraceae bacterium]|nr:guanylate kinase [Oscillospiraceae bacterium]